MFNVCEQICICMMMMIIIWASMLKTKYNPNDIMYPALGIRHRLRSISDDETQLTRYPSEKAYRIWWYNSLRLNTTEKYTDHYNDVIMTAIASQITSLTIVYSAVYSDADQRKHQSSASLAFVREIHRGPVNSPYKWPVTRKCFHLMTSSCESTFARCLSSVGCLAR